jgi:hypothetical protein
MGIDLFLLELGKVSIQDAQALLWIIISVEEDARVGGMVVIGRGRL